MAHRDDPVSMDHTTLILLGTAATLGFVHTLIGVDHTLPFVVLGRAEGWTLRRLLWITGLCGLGHVLSSVVIGLGGIALGLALRQLEWFEQTRGGLAAYALIGFGLAYMVWGIYQGWRGKRHRHVHIHPDGVQHDHDHAHHGEHSHVHPEGRRARGVTVLALAVVFLLGPCEVLIPLLIVPAFEHTWWVLGGVVVVFGAATIGTMLTVVTLGHLGLRHRRFDALDRYMHALAGGAIVASGLAIQLLGV